MFSSGPRILYRKMKNCAKSFIYGMRGGRPPRRQLRFVYHLADHCNLNCRCCDHFSPLAKEHLADIDSFEKDVRRLAELCGGVCEVIDLEGGEPLLHPDAISFAVVARKYFKHGTIKFFTNGLLLGKQPDAFWNVCACHHIDIVVTRYPIAFDYKSLQKKAEGLGVCLDFVNGVEQDKTTYLIPLDLSGSQPAQRNYYTCMHANDCIMLKEGRLYPCTVAPNIEHFNTYFHQSVPLTDADSINIYEAESFEEISAFLAKPIPFCRYCNVRGREFGLKWGVSKKDIFEWVKDDT